MPRQLPLALLLLRLGIFIVFLFWTLDKLLLILLFVASLFKTWTYGAILIFHGISTPSSFGTYLERKP
jgi:hypothetical protein